MKFFVIIIVIAVLAGAVWLRTVRATPDAEIGDADRPDDGDDGLAPRTPPTT